MQHQREASGLCTVIRRNRAWLSSVNAPYKGLFGNRRLVCAQSYCICPKDARACGSNISSSCAHIHFRRFPASIIRIKAICEMDWQCRWSCRNGIWHLRHGKRERWQCEVQGLGASHVPVLWYQSQGLLSFLYRHQKTQEPKMRKDDELERM